MVYFNLRRKFDAESSWRFCDVGCGIGPHLLTVIPLGEVKVDLNAFNVKFVDKLLRLELQKNCYSCKNVLQIFYIFIQDIL
jgi:hypothetical protein